MLCSSIKLTDRREFKQEKTPKRKNKSTMLEEKLFMKSDYYHSYTFRWDKPKKHHYSCNNLQYLTIKNIIFPENLSPINKSASFLRRSKKTPRLKSKYCQSQFYQKELNNDNDLSISVLADQLSKETEELIEEIKSTTNIEAEVEIDPDIQQLILSTREAESKKEDEQVCEDNKPEEKKRKKSKRKEKDEEKDENKKGKARPKTKVIKFSLSKPPSPQTVQVIRVDVTSNFSMEEEAADTNRTDSNVSDCSKGCGMKIRKDKAIKEILHRQASLSMAIGSNEVNLMCRKLTLKDRHDEVTNGIEII